EGCRAAEARHRVPDRLRGALETRPGPRILCGGGADCTSRWVAGGGSPGPPAKHLLGLCLGLGLWAAATTCRHRRGSGGRRRRASAALASFGGSNLDPADEAGAAFGTEAVEQLALEVGELGRPGGRVGDDLEGAVLLQAARLAVGGHGVADDLGPSCDHPGRGHPPVPPPGPPAPPRAAASRPSPPRARRTSASSAPMRRGSRLRRVMPSYLTPPRLAYLALRFRLHAQPAPHALCVRHSASSPAPRLNSTSPATTRPADRSGWFGSCTLAELT